MSMSHKQAVQPSRITCAKTRTVAKGVIRPQSALLRRVFPQVLLLKKRNMGSWRLLEEQVRKMKPFFVEHQMERKAFAGICRPILRGRRSK